MLDVIGVMLCGVDDMLGFQRKVLPLLFQATWVVRLETVTHRLCRMSGFQCPQRYRSRGCCDIHNFD